MDFDVDKENLKKIQRDALEQRKADHGVDRIFVERWSPRALSGDIISDSQLMKLFEASRWAPSSFNNQPWHIIYAKRDTEEWDRLYSLLGDFNKKWSKHAAVLGVFVSQEKNDKGKPIRTHSYCTGAAWMSLALQGSMMGLAVHGMSGFDYDRARVELKVPGDHKVEAMFAVGRYGNKEDLPDDLRTMEIPNSRKKVSEFIHEGGF